jgi:hypothetical protein
MCDTHFCVGDIMQPNVNLIVVNEDIMAGCRLQIAVLLSSFQTTKIEHIVLRLWT